MISNILLQIEKEDYNKSAIYIIKSLINDKIYIGSSNNIIERFRKHKSLLYHNKHNSIILQRFYNKNGDNNLSFQILEYCDTDRLIIREQFWLDLLNPKFNIRKIADSNKGIKRTKETLSKRVKGKLWSEEAKQRLIESNKYKINPCKGKKRNEQQINNISKGVQEAFSKIEVHPNSKLNKEQVLEIRKMLVNNIKLVNIGKHFNVSETVIHNIKRGNTYKKC